MQLTRYTDYGLRVLMYLALLPEHQQASIDQISAIYGISRNNINKIVHQLGKEGLICTKRGKGGGISLAVSPTQINIADVVTTLENNLSVVDCNKPACVILPACRLKGALLGATNAFIEHLKQYTLADLVEEKRKDLSYLLEI